MLLLLTCAFSAQASARFPPPHLHAPHAPHTPALCPTQRQPCPTSATPGPHWTFRGSLRPASTSPLPSDVLHSTKPAALSRLCKWERKERERERGGGDLQVCVFICLRMRAWVAALSASLVFRTSHHVPCSSISLSPSVSFCCRRWSGRPAGCCVL